MSLSRAALTLLLRSALLVFLGLGIVQCDVDAPAQSPPSSAPPVRIIGTNLGGASPVVPADGTLQIAFDRYLLPSTVSRQSFLVLDSFNQPINALRTIYDPVARTVTIAGARGVGTPWLTAGLSYKLVLPNAEAPENEGRGLRAIDRAPLAPDAPREFVFRAEGPSFAPRYEPVVDFCAHVWPVFARTCSTSQCHGDGASPPMGLSLFDPARLGSTAINVVALASASDARPSYVEPFDPYFGRNMHRIAPGDPGLSWLVYKLELAPASSTSRCDPLRGPCMTPLAPAALDAPASERARLAEFIGGDVMPPPDSGISPLSYQERAFVRAWIAEGAPLKECTIQSN